MKLVELLANSKSEQSKEEILRREFELNEFTAEELQELKEHPSITRHLSLIHIVEKQIEEIEFRESEEKAKNESVIMKILGFPW